MESVLAFPAATDTYISFLLGRIQILGHSQDKRVEEEIKSLSFKIIGSDPHLACKASDFIKSPDY